MINAGATFKFQFHNGPIKSCPAVIKTALIHGFNSTMVRLKESRRFRAVLMAAKFQFHNGPIKSSRLPTLFRPKISFQFHNGPIKRFQQISKPPISKKFQFHNGPIKRNRLPFASTQSPSFNSTMVRLKALPKPYSS